MLSAEVSRKGASSRRSGSKGEEGQVDADPTPTILVVGSRTSYVVGLVQESFGDEIRLRLAMDAEDGLRQLRQCSPALVLADFGDDLDSEGLAGFVQRSNFSSSGEPKLFVFHGKPQTVIADASWNGAAQLRNRPESPDDLRATAAEIRKSLNGTANEPVAVLSGDQEVRRIEGKSVDFETRVPQLFTMLDQISRSAAHDLTVLLVGETGSGKTTLAKLIHERSPRAEKGGFLHVACGALPPGLLESELFGHAKGAFTGADRAKVGKFECAGHGTLLLDEIDTLTMEQQAVLLKVIDLKEFEPVGSNDTKRFEGRLIVASNVCLDALVEKKQFREDLFYRLNVLRFHIPPLRERDADIVPLAMQFANNFSNECGIGIRRVSPEFLAAIQSYHWPGNLRELRNCMERAVALSINNELTPECLPPGIARAMHSAPAQPAVGSSLNEKVAMSEQEIIIEALKRNNNKRNAAAKELNISRVTLYNKMKKYNLL